MRSPVSLHRSMRALRRTARRAFTDALGAFAVTIFEGAFRVFGVRHSGRKLELERAESVLIVRLDEIGDTILTTPFLRELRGNMPAAWITLVVKPECVDLFSTCPHVDEVLTYQGRRHRAGWEPRYWWDALDLSRRKLWARRFDLAIVPRWDADYYHATLLAYLSAARWRAGYSERVIDHKHRLNRGYDRFLTHSVLGSSLMHEAARGLELIRALGGTVQSDRLELWTSRKDEDDAEELLSREGLSECGLLVALGPGAGAPKRLWPASRFAEIAKWLADEFGARVVVIGGKGEEQLGEAIRGRAGDTAVNLVGKTSLRQTVAILRRCDLFVGNDSGPMHLAAAAGIPVVEISCHPITGSPLHSNSPARFGPWGVPSEVIQPVSARLPCTEGCEANDAHCILGVDVEQVREAIRRLISGRGGQPGATEAAVRTPTRDRGESD